VWADATVSTSSKIDDLERKVNELTKKPEVRKDQKTSLEVTKNQINARYYKDGFFTDSKKLIPAIKSIEVFPGNTIKMTFVNGDTQVVTAQSVDSYDFEDGLLRCIAKEMIGKEGASVLSKLLAYATKFYENAEAEKERARKEKEEREAATARQRKRRNARWEKKRKKERDARIQEMAEAIVRAEEMKKNV
jgi:hypothetical protein